MLQKLKNIVTSKTFIIRVKEFVLVICLLFFLSESTFSQGRSDTIQDKDTLTFPKDTLTDKQLACIFTRMVETDGSNLDNYYVRKEIFKNNFDVIILITRMQGFPQFKVSPKRRKQGRGSITVATALTFIHVLQTQPELMLNLDIITLLKGEINANRLDKRELAGMQFLHYENTRGNYLLTPETQKMFDLTVLEWGLTIK